MSAVETPPPPTPVERRCPRCGAQLSAEQEWCLECGTGVGVGTRIASPRGWRASVAAVGLLLALALLAAILAIVELAGPAERVTEVPATPTPAPTQAPPAESATPVPSVSATPEGEAPADLAEWPENRTAWTVVLNSSGTREDAERIATDLAGKGVPGVGVVDSDDFQSLGPDSFVVFSGQYPDREQAEAALTQVRDRAGGGSTRRFVPTAG